MAKAKRRVGVFSGGGGVILFVLRIFFNISTNSAVFCVLQ